MEHIFFEAQLCSEIHIFIEISIFRKTDHPGLATGLSGVTFGSLWNEFSVAVAALTSC